MASTTSLVQVDFEQMLTSLQQEVVNNSALWQDLLADSSGQALLEFIATMGSYGVYANERALQEAFPDSARLISSVYAAMRLLGIRLSRKLPASCTATVSKPADGQAYVIPAYSQMSSPQGPMFNRSAITFTNTQVSQNVTLYAGTVKTINVTGTGNPLQTFISLDTNFTVSDADVVVTVNKVGIPVVTDGLWNYGAQTLVINGLQTSVVAPAVQDKTTNNGELELDFGNTNYGTMPSAGQPVSIIYAITNGLADNNAAFSGLTITYDNYSTIISTSGLSGGANEIVPSTYQRLGPGAFASLNRAVNRSEYDSVAAQYPGVIDAQLHGQSLIAPTLVTYMNAIRVALLTSSPWSTTQQQAFTAWMQQRSMAYMNFFFVTPQPVNYQIVCSVFCNSTADLSTVKQNVQSALTTLTTPGFGWIGRTVYVTEISDTIYKADSNVLYTKMNSPTVDFITKFNLTTLVAVQTGSGNAPPTTTVSYFITGVNSFSGSPQESLPITLAFTTNAQTGQGINLSWDAVNGLTSINIYTSRSGGTPGLLASLPGNATSYFDNFSATPTTQQSPALDNFGVWYPNCTNIQVNVFPASDRGTGVGG